MISWINEYGLSYVNGKCTTIGINRERYAQLAEKKQALEGTVGRRFSWGAFLLILAGLHPVDEFVNKKGLNRLPMQGNEGASE